MAQGHGLIREEMGIINPLRYNGGVLTGATLFAAISAAGGSSATLLLTPGEWLITADLTIPQNICVAPAIGARLVVSSGVTLTIAAFRGNGQHSLAGAGTILLHNYVFSPHDFGAIGDGATHPLSTRYGTLGGAQSHYPHAVALTDQIDWAAIQMAINVASIQPNGGEVELGADRQYALNRTTIMRKHVSMRGQGSSTEMWYIGTAQAIDLNPATGLLDAWHCRLERFTLRDFTMAGTVGIYLKDIAHVDIDNVSVQGRPAEGIPTTGFATAGIYFDATPATGGCITVSIDHCYVQACAGDGIRGVPVNANNAITISHSRVQGNLGWGIRFLGQVRNLAINSNKSIEGNALGSIYVAGFLGFSHIGNYHEGSGPVLHLPGSVESSGLVSQGNMLQGPGSGSAYILGTLGPTGFPVDGATISGNAIVSYASAFDPQKIRNSVLGPNGLFFTANDLSNNLGFDTVGLTRVANTRAMLVGGPFSTARVIVTNRTDEVVVFSAPIEAHRIRDVGALELWLTGTYVNTTGGGTFQIRLMYGFLQWLIFDFGTVPQDPFQRSFSLFARLSGDAVSVTLQDVFGIATLSEPITAGTGSIPWKALQAERNEDQGVNAASSGQVLEVRAKHSVAHAQTTFTKFTCHSKFIPF